MSAKILTLDNSRLVFRRILSGEMCEFLVERGDEELIVLLDRGGEVSECYHWLRPTEDAEVKGPVLLALKQAAAAQFTTWDGLDSKQRIGVVCAWCEEHALACADRLYRFVQAAGNPHELCELSDRLVFFAEEVARATDAMDIAADIRGAV